MPRRRSAPAAVGAEAFAISRSRAFGHEMKSWTLDMFSSPAEIFTKSPSCWLPKEHQHIGLRALRMPSDAVTPIDGDALYSGALMRFTASQGREIMFELYRHFYLATQFHAFREPTELSAFHHQHHRFGLMSRSFSRRRKHLRARCRVRYTISRPI